MTVDAFLDPAKPIDLIYVIVHLLPLAGRLAALGCVNRWTWRSRSCMARTTSIQEVEDANPHTGSCVLIDANVCAARAHSLVITKVDQPPAEASADGWGKDCSLGCCVAKWVYLITTNHNSPCDCMRLGKLSLRHHHPNQNNQQYVGWGQTSRHRTAGNAGLMPGLELGLYRFIYNRGAARVVNCGVTRACL